MTDNNISSANPNPKKLNAQQWGAIQFKEALDQMIAASEECNFDDLTQQDATVLHLFAHRLLSAASTLHLTCRPDVQH
ncbi:hypothetical protein [Methylomonas sp. YC3]